MRKTRSSSTPRSCSARSSRTESGRHWPASAWSGIGPPGSPRYVIGLPRSSRAQHWLARAWNGIGLPGTRKGTSLGYPRAAAVRHWATAVKSGTALACLRLERHWASRGALRYVIGLPSRGRGTSLGYRGRIRKGTSLGFPFSFAAFSPPQSSTNWGLAVECEPTRGRPSTSRKKRCIGPPRYVIGLPR